MLRVRDISHGAKVLSRATVLQKKTGQSVQFEIMEQTREAVERWIYRAGLRYVAIRIPQQKGPIKIHYCQAIYAYRQILNQGDWFRSK